MEAMPYGRDALNTKRLPLPRLETLASRDLALQNLGGSVHFWPSRRKGDPTEGESHDPAQRRVT
jgi:hypothetical protein